MNAYYEILILSSLFITVVGLLIVLMRKCMQILGCSTTSIYKLWWVFLVGFALIVVLYLNNPINDISSGFTQSIEMPSVHITYNKVVESDWKLPLLLVWAVVSSMLLIRLLWNYYTLKKGLNLNSVQENKIVKTAIIDTPVAFGFFKSKVYVPFDFEHIYTKSQQILLLKHESIHCNRYDPFLLIMYKLLIALFWFHPVIYLLNHYMKKDQESSCDEIVLKKSQQPTEYSRLLLQLNQQINPLATNTKSELYCSSSSMLKERIMLIKNLKPKGIINKLLSQSLLLVSAASIFITTTVLADIVKVAKEQQKFIEVPKPIKPTIVPISHKVMNNDKQKIVLTPQADKSTKYVGLLKPKAPNEPTAPKAPASPKSPKLEANPVNKLVALSTPRPNYPRKAAIAKVNGYVVVEFDVMTDGSVKNPLVIESEPQGVFNREAVRSVEKYKFKPLDEKMRVRRKVEFSMN